MFPSKVIFTISVQRGKQEIRQSGIDILKLVELGVGRISRLVTNR